MRRHCSRIRILAGLVAAAVLATACASSQPFVISGEALDKAGAVFLLTAHAYDAALDQKLVTAEQYNHWKVFGQDFQQSYRPAVTTWKAARSANDAALEKTTTARINGLMATLSQYGLVVGLQVYDLLKSMPAKGK